MKLKNQIAEYLQDISEDQINLSSEAARERLAEEIAMIINAEIKKSIEDFVIKITSLEDAKRQIQALEKKQESIFSECVEKVWGLGEKKERDNGEIDKLFDYVYNNFPKERSKIVKFLLDKYNYK